MLTYRTATEDDLVALRALMALAIDQLQPDLTPDQVEASHQIMGIDSQLIRDGTYYVVERDGELAGCGGWSARATLYGGDHSVGRDARMLNPTTHPARVRAMYTHPDHIRQGVGRAILNLCEAAASEAGFRQVELMATMAGKKLYEACGYEPFGGPVFERIGDAEVPLIRMKKAF